METKVRKLNEIAKKRGQTLAQMSLAWIFLCTIHRQNIIRIKKRKICTKNQIVKSKRLT